MGTRGLVIAGILVLAGLAIDAGLRRPIHNWDVIVYTAIVHGGGASEEDPAVLHRRTFEEVERTVPADAFARLVAAGDDAVPDAAYRRAVHEDPRVFAEQLAFYRGRPLYVAMLRGLYRGGVDVVTGTTVISTASMVVVAVCIMLAARVLVPPLMLPVVVLLAIIFRVPGYASLASPDPLAMAFVAVAFTLLVHGRMAACFGVLLAAMSVRPDLVMLLLVTAGVGVLAATGDGRRQMLAAGFGVVGLVLYAVLDRLSGHPGLGVVMYHTMVERLLLPISEPQSFGIMAHVAILPARASSFAQRGSLPVFVLVLGVAAAAAIWRWRRTGRRPELGSLGGILVAITALSVLGHFLVYPLGQERFYAMQFIFGSIGALSVTRGEPEDEP